MINVSALTDLDKDGIPRNYTDEHGMTWIYQGKRYGTDEWGGIPKED